MLKRAGWNRRRARGQSLDRVTRIVPVEWVDMETGQILSTSELRVHVKHTGHRMPGVVSISERTIRAAAKVGECAPSEREFVAAVLRLRNHRGGLVLDLGTLIGRWLAWKHPDIRPDHVARKRQQLARILEKRNVMVNAQTLYRELQITGPIDAEAVLSEGAKAYSVIPVHRKRNGRPRPHLRG